MLTLKEIKKQVEDLESVVTLTQAYEEISSLRMKKVRDVVLAKRIFMEEINDVFEEVRDSYAEKVKSLLKSKNKRAGKITFLAHNGKTVNVFLSANTGLYGSIIRETFEKFIEDVRRTNSEVTIVGKLGLSMYLQEEPNRPYTYFDLLDQSVSSDQLSDLVKHIVQYEKINVFYGKFLNVAKQVPNIVSISAEIDLSTEEKKTQKYFIFEPQLERILTFFEEEIFASLFEQTVKESELAKSASRVIAMDKASSNIKDYLKELKKMSLMAMHRKMNRKQVELLVGAFGKVKQW
jgi:ATP synthase F1 gamma subunit